MASSRSNARASRRKISVFQAFNGSTAIFAPAGVSGPPRRWAGAEGVFQAPSNRVAVVELNASVTDAPDGLIQFALQWYHVPPNLANIIFTYYEMIFATIEAGPQSVSLTKSESFKVV